MEGGRKRGRREGTHWQVMVCWVAWLKIVQMEMLDEARVKVFSGHGCACIDAWVWEREMGGHKGGGNGTWFGS